jgi:hypothetical protein
MNRAQAVQKIKKLIVDARPKLGKEVSIDEEKWEADVLMFAVSIQGQKITGTLAVTDLEYDVDIKLPLMLRLFEGKIKQAIEDQAAQLMK